MYIENFIMNMEGRLLNIIYRVNWITNIFNIKEVIDLGIIIVNKNLDFVTAAYFNSRIEL